ncbi:FadR/GntR family transcriptional regulator [Nocardia salmonicida]|uniref:FadR/GntR family transcriptional regulator n=1 Tax=Nocardia salmonicida TaxID=53431 RepID=UPI003791FF9A
MAADLRRRIITGALDVGDPLPNEASLMETYGVSRPTLREAFRILESESIITVLRGAHGGARVLALDPTVAARYTGLLLQYNGTPLADVYRARTELEVAALGMIGNQTGKALAATADRIDQIIAEGAEVIADSQRYSQHDVRAHQTLIELTGNVTLGTLSEILFEIIASHNVAFMATHSAGQEAAAAKAAQRSWVKLAKMLRDGDIAAAQTYWRRHLEGVSKFMVDSTEASMVDLLS